MTRAGLWVALFALLALPRPVAAAPGELTAHTLTVGGVERRFLLYAPATYDGQTPVPVLLMFHGANSDAETAAGPVYGWQETADTNGFLVVYPDSLTPPPKDIVIGGRVVAEAYDLTGKRWDIAHILNGHPLWGNPGKSRCDSPDVAFVAALLDWLAAHHAVQTGHIFASGHSYGGVFSYYVAACLPGRIAAFAAHSAGAMSIPLLDAGELWPLPVPPARAVTLPGILLHSRDDPMMDYSTSQTLYAALTANGHPAQLVTLSGSGHHWDKAHNQTQWDFFMAHAGPASTAFLPLQAVATPAARRFLCRPVIPR